MLAKKDLQDLREDINKDIKNQIEEAIVQIVTALENLKKLQEVHQKELKTYA